MQNIQNLLLMPHNLTEEETYEGIVSHKDKERRATTQLSFSILHLIQSLLQEHLSKGSSTVLDA
jgi:hypothetical protein